MSQVLIFHLTTPFSCYTLQRRLNIYNGVFFAKIPSGVELLTFLQEKLHPRCLTRMNIGFPTDRLSQKNIQPEKMRDVVFEKATGCGRKVNRASAYAEAAVRRVL